MYRHFLISIVGNLLKHYDTALFGLLAPFLAPLFFHKEDPVTALLLTYAIIPLGFLTKPLGALFFGWIGDRFEKRVALIISLTGMAISTAAIGFLPTSVEVGELAPFLLSCFRLLQSFFAAGETPGGALYLLENVPASKRTLAGSLFDTSTIGGSLLASSLVMFFFESWRALFWLGGSTALLCLWIRCRKELSPSLAPPPPVQLQSVDPAYKKNLVVIACMAGFSYATYSLSFPLMCGYIPLVTSLSKETMMRLNTYLTLFDFFLLPFFGLIAQKFGKEKVMMLSSLLLGLLILPLFSSLGPATTLTQVVIMRFIVVILGLAFAAPYHAFALEQTPPQNRTTILCLGYTLGSQLIGAPTAAISLWLYQKTGWTGAPALYLLPIALSVPIVLLLARKKSELTNA